MKPKLSQVFLHNESVLQRIAESAKLTKDDVVFEIGSGKGQLTKYLAKMARKVYACELDKMLIPYLFELNAVVINKDFLEIEIPSDVTVIIGNIPYHLSSEITEKVLRAKKKALILYQKEFANRLVAKPSTKDYSRITILSQLLSKPKKLFDVNRHNFIPTPKVDSTLVEFTPTNEAYDELFFSFTRILFQFKNKSVQNALINGRASWTGESEKKKIRERVKGFSNKKVKDLTIAEIKEECEKFKKII